MAGRYRVDIQAGRTTEFVCRGSNRHPVGKTIRTSTIAAHRDMSNTTYPGDACDALVKGALAAAKASGAGVVAPPSTPASTPGTTDEIEDPGAPESTPRATTAAPIGEEDAPPPATAAPPTVQTAGGDDKPEGSSASGRLLGIGGLGAISAAIVLRRRQTRTSAESRWYSIELLDPHADDHIVLHDESPEPRPLDRDVRSSAGPPGHH